MGSRCAIAHHPSRLWKGGCDHKGSSTVGRTPCESVDLPPLMRYAMFITRRVILDLRRKPGADFSMRSVMTRGRRRISGGVLSEGVFIIVDLDSGEVVRMVDTGDVPIPDAEADFDEESVGTLREIPTRLSIHQPDGPGFTVFGQFIRWQNWSFHRRIDPRVGLVLSLIRYRDNGADRMVLYEASLSELFVPYMEPSAGWYSRTYFDIGDYGPRYVAQYSETRARLSSLRNAF